MAAYTHLSNEDLCVLTALREVGRQSVSIVGGDVLTALREEDI